MTARYLSYGLTFAADFPLPEMPAAVTDVADVTIRLAPVPDHLPRPEFRAAFYEATATEVLLRVPGVANYLVRDGCHMLVEPTGSAAAARYFLYTTPMAALLMQRGISVLRGSAVHMPGGALVLLGDPGMGKSVIAAALHRAGNPLLADELCVIDPDGTAVLAGPRLHWLSARDVVGLDLQAHAIAPRPGVDREVVPLPPPPCAPATIRSVCVLDAWNEAGIDIRSVPHAARSLGFLANMALRPLHDRFGDPRARLERAMAWARLAHFRAICPRKDRSISDTVAAITGGMAS